MNKQILSAAFAVSFIAPTAFAQMNYQSRAAGPPVSSQQMGSSVQKTTTTKTKTTYPQGVKGYLDSQMAGSSDKKFHVTMNGKDVALTPVKIHEEKKGSGNKSTAAADMKGPDGKMYQINFVLTGGAVSGASVGK